MLVRDDAQRLVGERLADAADALEIRQDLAESVTSKPMRWSVVRRAWGIGDSKASSRQYLAELQSYGGVVPLI